jgi:hypothetical protein
LATSAETNAIVLRLFLSFVIVAAVAPPAGADSILVDKLPTDALCCLDGTSSDPRGAFVLGGSFVFDGASGTLLRTVGAYMQRMGDGNPDDAPLPGTGTPFGFDVLDDRTLRACVDQSIDALCSFSFTSPALAQSNDASHFQGTDFLPHQSSAWTLVTAPLDRPVPLVAGSKYWILVSTFFLPSQGAYLLGDRPGTGQLAASFDPALATFYDAANLVKLGADFNPAMDLAIYASGAEPLPEPATLTLVMIGAAAIFCRRPIRIDPSAGPARGDGGDRGRP